MAPTHDHGHVIWIIGALLSSALLTACDLELDAVGDDHARIDLVRTRDEAPAWTVRYGDEFWRQQPASDAQASGASGVDLGEVVDRVSHAITQPAGAPLPRVTAATYTASFDGRGLRFAPNRSPGDLEAAPGTELRVRTRRVAIGGQDVYRLGAAVPWSALGNTAQGLLDAGTGLVEHHEVRGDGVELSWVLRDPRAGDGELVVDVAIDGLQPAGQTAGGIHLADATGLARVRIGVAELVDARGERWPVAAEIIDGGLRWRVTAAILVSASFPVALDPTISAELGVDQPQMADPVETAPSVAFNGTDYLVTWQDRRHATASGTDVYATRVSAAGTIRDASGLEIATAPGDELPAVASNGVDFLVVWIEHLDDQARVRGLRISAAGEVMDAPFAVSMLSPWTDYPEAYPAVASNGTDYLVVWTHSSSPLTFDVYAARVSAAGVVQDVPNLILAQSARGEAAPAVASNGSDYLVVWERFRILSEVDWDEFNIFGTRVTAAGVVQDVGGLGISTTAEFQHTPSVASNGTDYFVAWTELNWANNSYDIRGTRVTAAGVVHDPAGIGISTAPYGQQGQAIASNGAEYIAVWLDNRGYPSTPPTITGARISNAGGVQDPNGFVIAAGAQSNWRNPSIATDGTDFLVAWSRARPLDPSSSDVYSTLLSAGGVVGTTQPIEVDSALNRVREPAVASNGTTYLVAWADDRYGSDIYGARVSNAGDVMDVAGLEIAAQAKLQHSPAVASNGTDYFVAWADRASAGTSADIRGARIRASGEVLDAATGIFLGANAAPRSPSVASDGVAYLVTWESPSPGGIYGRAVSPSPPIVPSNVLAISTGFHGQSHVASASNGTDYLVVWEDNRNVASTGADVFGARMSSDGTIYATLAISTADGDQRRPSIASNRADYLVAWEDRRTEAATGVDVYGARVSALGAGLGPVAFPISTAPDDQQLPSVGSNHADYVVTWMDQRNRAVSGTDIYAARVIGSTSEAELVISDGGHDERSPQVAGAMSDCGYLVVYESQQRIAARLATGWLAAGACDSLVQIDECAFNNGGCAQTCTDSLTSYACSCGPTYVLAPDGLDCDIDECATNNGGCAQICANSPGSFACACGPGYALAADGAACDDIDECAVSNGGCDQTCTNIAGSRTCACGAGYLLERDGQSCRDVNACSPDHGCAQLCTLVDGADTCACQRGYRLADDGLACDDIDECATAFNGCPQHAACTNKPGGYTCTCVPGFASEGTRCTADASGDDGGCGCRTADPGSGLLLALGLALVLRRRRDAPPRRRPQSS